jgi:HK97 family phage major capsid protein
MDNLSALREKISTLANQAQHLIQEKGDQVWNKDEQAKFDGLTNDIESAKQSIKNIEKARELDADKFFNEVTSQAKKTEVETIGAMDAVALYLRNGSNVTAEQAAAIRNVMSTTTGSEGGFTVPTEIASMVIDALKAYGGMREVAEIVTTNGGNNWNYPTSDGTAELGAIVGQNATSGIADVTFGTVALNPFYYTSNQIALPLELIQDSAIDVISFVVNRLGQRLGRKQNSDFTIGGGTTLPDGVFPRATLGKTGITGQTLTVIYDDLVDTLRSVNRAYRGNAKWMMNDLSVGFISKLKDTTGRPIWTYGDSESITNGNPDTLLGYPVITNDDAPVMAANARSIAFGDFSKYIIRDVANTALIRRFDDSAFALKNQVGFCGWQRSGGNLVDTAAVKVYRNSAS